MPASRSAKKPSLGHVVKRWLYLIHRWIGIASCLLFVIWFASGLVMIYMPYPSLTQVERMAHLEPITWSAVTSLPSSAKGLRSIALEMHDGHPVWRLTPWGGDPTTASAEAAYPLGPIDAAMARRVAMQFGSVPVMHIEEISRDQWTVAQRYDRHRPLWKVTLGDAEGTNLYISSASGDVVLDTRRRERFWNWLGAVPHWIYPTILRQDGTIWRQVVLWVSGPCIAAAITGMWIGILRTRVRQRRYKGRRMTPYHGWMLWHHIAGLVGGLFLTTWIFSGWLSVDPGSVFHSDGISDTAKHNYAGDLVIPSDAFAGMAKLGAGIVRVEAISAIGDRTLLIVTWADATRIIVDARTHGPTFLSRLEIARATSRLVPGSSVENVELLSAPDAYWYEVGALPQLPVLRVKFSDSAATWVHIDPETGEVLGSLDQRGRAYRWLYDLLHKWDLNALTSHRPLWDLLLWSMSLLGLVTSISGIRIGWKRLQTRKRRLPSDSGRR